MHLLEAALVLQAYRLLLYSQCNQWPLRLGDALSPLLFNLVADALSAMLDKAVMKGHITGVMEYLIQGGFLTYSMHMIL